MAGVQGKSSVHAFTAYNKFKSNGTLIGNYVEERCLEEATGFHRYPGWVDHEEKSDTVFAKTVGGPTMTDSYPRVLEHTDQLHPASWISQCHDTYRGPNRPDLQCKLSTLPKMGRREQMELDRLYKEAAALPEPDAPLKSFDTEQRAAYTETNLTGMKIGARVMLTQDGEEVMWRDPTFLAESKIIPRGTVDRMMPGAQMKTTVRSKPATQRADEEGVPYYEDIGVSIYSDAVLTDTYKGTAVAHGTIIRGTIPFARDSNFSKPIGDWSKIVEDE
mmetsp:Transcript_8637/g.24823  ORF Transcript_8637/g.24823 Transcript_8637/m.24823 type:complete len:275 (+) Transcript_8637:212-1036(+)